MKRPSCWLLFAACACALYTATNARSFTIENDRFVADGSAVQLIAGWHVVVDRVVKTFSMHTTRIIHTHSVHYFRIPRPYWRDRLQKLKAMGLNSIEMYIAWNFHERQPEQYTFDGDADVVTFLKEAASLDLKVLLRPGPYICAEWDFGGFPWWFASSHIAQGGRSMDLRSDDSDYLHYVERWWSVLFKRIKPMLWENGGPIVMVQIENEYGACSGTWGPERAQSYLRQLIGIARRELGHNVVLYTTDPPNQIERGTLRGGEVFSAVDFGPGWWQLDQAFGIQASYNPPGKSPPICTEFYTGWLTHWTEKMANTSSDQLVDWFSKILTYRNNSGSLSLYMAHGGTNFGFWAGANVGDTYQPHITSYDYDCPVSEAGTYGQPGIGGADKYQLLRQAVQKIYPDQPLPDVPPPSKVVSYGTLPLQMGPALLDVADALSNGGLLVDAPENMEQYNQSGGLTLYHINVPVTEFQGQVVLRLAVHDYAKVFVAGQLAGSISRNTVQGGVNEVQGGVNEVQDVVLSVPHGDVLIAAANPEGEVPLQVLVEAMGRSNFGCEWDLKGIISPTVTLNDKPLTGWRVYPLQLDSVAPAALYPAPRVLLEDPLTTLEDPFTTLEDPTTPQGVPARGWHAGSHTPNTATNTATNKAHNTISYNVDNVVNNVDGMDTATLKQGPVFLRASFDIAAGAAAAGNAGFPADTFLHTPGFSKGLAWINGFNLGWYWPAAGPQMRLYIPGTVLQEGHNELVLLEMDTLPSTLQARHQMGRVGEKLRQAVLPIGGFDPTSNQRNMSTLKELEAHEKTLKRTIKVIKEFHKSTSSVLSESEASYQTPLPRAYTLDTTKSMLPADTEDVLYTQKSVPAVPQERPDPAFSTAKTGSARVADVRGQLDDRMRNEVYVPVDKWLDDLTNAKKSMAAAEQLRLDLDHTRRTLANVEMKKVKQERNKGHASDTVLAKASTKSSLLESSKARYREKEQQVYEELLDLVERADVQRNALAATYTITRDIMTLAEVAAPTTLRASMTTSDKPIHPTASLAGDTPYATSTLPPAPASDAHSSPTQSTAPPATPVSTTGGRTPPGTAQTMVIHHEHDNGHHEDAHGYTTTQPYTHGGVPASPGSDEDVVEHYGGMHHGHHALPSY